MHTQTHKTEYIYIQLNYFTQHCKPMIVPFKKEGNLTVILSNFKGETLRNALFIPSLLSHEAQKAN